MDVATHDSPHQPLTASRCSVLVIEDDPNTADMLRILFELDGFVVRVAGDAVEGVRLARLAPPHVVVCDIGLPGALNGFDVAAVLRNDPATAFTFLVAVTASGDVAARSRAARAGFHAFFNKPVSYQGLLQTVIAGIEDRTTH